MKILSKIIYLSIMTGFASSAGAIGSLADVTVYDRVEQRALPLYQHNGRYYVVGKPGNEYQIRVANRGHQDILSVVSVDGVNAVSGETANWTQTGYVLSGHQGFDIRGWRKSMDRIAAFYFTEHRNSYAARTGRPDNVGVIGVAVFRKKFEPPVSIRPPLRPWPRPHRESPFAQSDEAAPGAAAAEAEGSDAVAQDRAKSYGGIARMPRKSTTLGTGHGRSETSQVTYTSFERATATPAEIITIHYDTRDNLLAMGVIQQPPVYAQPAPMPFPGQFVPDPR